MNALPDVKSHHGITQNGIFTVGGSRPIPFRTYTPWRAFGDSEMQDWKHNDE